MWINVSTNYKSLDSIFEWDVMWCNNLEGGSEYDNGKNETNQQKKNYLKQVIMWKVSRNNLKELKANNGNP